MKMVPRLAAHGDFGITNNDGRTRPMSLRFDGTEQLISAYVDGELSGDEQARAEQLLVADEHYEALSDDWRSIGTDLQCLPRYRLSDDFADRVLAAIAAKSESRNEAVDERIESGVASVAGAEPDLTGRRSLRWALVGLLSIAAAGAVVLIAAQFLPTDRVAVQTQPAPHSSGIGQSSVGESTAAMNSSDEGGDPAVASPADAIDPRTVSSSDSDPATTTHHVPASNIPTNVPDDQQAETGSTADRSASRSQAGDEVPRGIRSTEVRKMYVVYQVAVTPAGRRASVFAKSLAANGVPLAQRIDVDEPIQNSLLGSRFFKQVRARGGELEADPSRQDAAGAPNADAAAHEVKIYYVRALGEQIERIENSLVTATDHVASISMDIALLPEDSRPFQQLRRAAEEQPLGHSDEGTRAASDDPEPVHSSGSARPLHFDGWDTLQSQTVFRRELRTTNPANPKPDDARSPVPRGPRIGTQLQFEVLFIVHYLDDAPQPGGK